MEEASPDFSGAYEAFQTLRALRFAAAREPLLKTHRDKLKPDVIWNTEAGLKLTGPEIAHAERLRAALLKRVTTFFAEYDLLIAPAMQAKPYPVGNTYVGEIAGKTMKTYIDWITITFAISVTGCPALALPAGFSADGLPVGLQIVGPPRSEARLLAAGKQLEDMLGIAEQLPIDPRVALRREHPSWARVSDRPGSGAARQSLELDREAPRTRRVRRAGRRPAPTNARFKR